MNKDKENDMTRQLIDIINNEGWVELITAIAIVHIENQVNEILELLGENDLNE